MARRAEAEDVLEAARAEENARPSYEPPAWFDGATYDGKPKPKRRPAWRASTWRALARLASATAREIEWADRVAELAREAARAPATPARESGW